VAAERETIGARSLLLSLIDGAFWAQLVHVIAALGVADRLTAGTRSAEELAEDAGADAGALRRALRALVTRGVFHETEDGRFALNDAAEHLRAGHPRSLRRAALGAGEKRWQTFGSMLHSVRTGESAHRHAHGLGYFEYLAAHPDEAAWFREIMAAGTAELAPALLAAYRFPASGTVVDVGGAHGDLLAHILAALPRLRGVLFDLPEAVAGAPAALAEAGVADRCNVVAGDFFQKVPGGGDVYLLSWILHDWADDQALRLLRSCREAMAASATLLIVETLLPDRAEPVPPSRRHTVRNPFVDDLIMLLNTGGRERTECEYTALLAQAGFAVSRIVPLRAERSAHLIEATPATGAAS
jgi:hypothetical protein